MPKPQMMDDAADGIITPVLERHGKVVFFENRQLQEQRQIALILDY